MKKNFGMSNSLSSKLRAEVERQLLIDLQHYGVTVDVAEFDWSESTFEGHATDCLGGTMHNFSNVAVLNRGEKMVACGWIDFIHGGDSNPLHVFWDQLTILQNGDPRRQKVRKATPGIPLHIWEQLSESSKKLCTISDRYDSMWFKDPVVLEWQKAQKCR